MKIRLSCDDGCASDVRVAELAKKYNIECIFYWPVEWHSLAFDNGYKPLMLAEADEIAHQFSIGSHTITHRHLTKIPPEEAYYEILASKTMLEDLFGVKIDKFAPPRGYTNEQLTTVTMKYYKTQRLTKGVDLVHIHPNSGANGNEIWQDAINEMTQELWCHSWELDKYNLWDELEAYLASPHP